jgi:hypothetical protein
VYIISIERTAMWTLEDAVNNSTNTVVIPKDGIITISKPDTARVNAYVNDAMSPTQQVAVKAGDTVYFKLTNYKKGETPIGIMYDDVSDVIMLPGKVSEAQMSKVIAVEGEPIAIISESTTEEDDMTPQDTINLFGSGMGGGGQGGAMGAGLGAGLVGGLLGTALFGRNGLGGIGGVDGGVAGAVLRNPPEQDMANMSLMQAIGAVDKSVAVSTATMEASQATQTLGITTQLNSVASSLAGRTDNLKDVVNANSVALMQGQNALTQTVMAGNSLINQNIMENRYELSKDISADGEKTRALITQQYEINLQRQLSDANAAIIELRSREYTGGVGRGVEVTTTNNINQMQQQQQSQQQYSQLANMIWGLGQNIQNSNAAINVGSGTQTSTPTNTNTNIR